MKKKKRKVKCPECGKLKDYEQRVCDDCYAKIIFGKKNEKRI